VLDGDPDPPKERGNYEDEKRSVSLVMTDAYLSRKQERVVLHAIKRSRVGRRSRRTFTTDFDIFRRRVDGVVIYFFNSDVKFFDDASEFSVTSLCVVFISCSKVMLIFQLNDKSSVVGEMGDRLATIDMGRREGAAVPLSGGGSWAPSNTMCLGRDLPSY